MLDLQEMMKAELKSIGVRINILKKQHRELEKENKPRYQVTEKIERLEKQKKFYQASKSEPVRFKNGVVINAKLVKEYLKKLPRSATVAFNIGAHSLTVVWESHHYGKGSFVFLDLADWYEGFALPDGEELIE